MLMDMWDESAMAKSQRVRRFRCTICDDVAHIAVSRGEIEVLAIAREYTSKHYEMHKLDGTLPANLRWVVCESASFDCPF